MHDASGTGALGTPSSGVTARVSYAAAYYDLLGRTTASVDVGTNGGTAWTRPGTVPSRSDTVLVNSVAYDAAGRAWKSIDPKGIESRATFDLMGRTTKTVQNYVDGTVSDTDDKTVEYSYSAAGMTKLKAKLTGGGSQDTEYVFGVTQSGGSGVDSNDLVGATKWPDASTGASSSSEQETQAVNALGQTVTKTDRNGTVHTLGYDVLGRVTSDAVTTLGSGVDGAVRRVETAYDSQGNAYLLTSYSAATGGTVVTQVQRQFDGLGNLTREWQSHSGAVNTSTTPSVQYGYSALDSSNRVRLTSMTYPSGSVLTYNYSTGLNSDISRLSSISDAGGTLEGYEYLGLGTVVRRTHAGPGVDLTFIGSGTGDGGDQYLGLDRFGRVVTQKWVKAGTSTDEFGYAYDRDGNRLTRSNAVNSAFGEVYTYDGLNQLASTNRGSGTRTQSFDYDAVGNRDGVTTNGSTQTYTANKQNEITSVSGATTPTYDANGNMTTDETGRQFVYDAWNRLKVVKNSGGTTLKMYLYDASGRRVAETASGTTTDLYYSAAWQVLEEAVSGSTTTRYVWSPVYVDAMILRDRDTDANGSLDERLWVQQDANFNVTALVNASGTVIERYAYDPYGVATVMNASWTTLGGSAYSWVHLHQGGRFDATSGLYDFRNRQYSPTLGRWVAMDPIRYSAGDVNLYAFISNNPDVFRDPNGTAKLEFRVGTPTLEDDKAPAVLDLLARWSETDNAAQGGIKIEQWEKRAGLRTYSYDELKGHFKLPAPGTVVGSTGVEGSFESKGTYAIVVTEVSDLKNSWNPNGTMKLSKPGERENIVKCGYHLLQAKFAVYSSEKKAFNFKGTWNGQTLANVVTGKDTEKSADGSVMIFIGRNPGDKKVYVSVKAKVGVAEFGTDYATPIGPGGDKLNLFPKDGKSIDAGKNFVVDFQVNGEAGKK